MWRGYEPALVAYGIVVIDVWTATGRADTVRGKIWPHLHGEPARTQGELATLGMLPPWLGRDDGIAPTVRRSSGRCLRFIGPCSPKSRKICRTSGRSDPAVADLVGPARCTR
jgi:hypothetical protein